MTSNLFVTGLPATDPSTNAVPLASDSSAEDITRVQTVNIDRYGFGDRSALRPVFDTREPKPFFAWVLNTLEEFCDLGITTEVQIDTLSHFIANAGEDALHRSTSCQRVSMSWQG
jgi:hypothetical protein